jgi:hypothetical protein
MGRKGHSEEEIPRILRDAESVQTAIEVCRKHGHVYGLFRPR